MGWLAEFPLLAKLSPKLPAIRQERVVRPGMTLMRYSAELGGE